jgi:hypothetical protein
MAEFLRDKSHVGVIAAQRIVDGPDLSKIIIEGPWTTLVTMQEKSTFKNTFKMSLD